MERKRKQRQFLTKKSFDWKNFFAFLTMTHNISHEQVSEDF